MGQVFIWGCGDHGLLGVGDTNDCPVPRRIDAFRGLPITAVALGLGRIAGAITGTPLRHKWSGPVVLTSEVWWWWFGGGDVAEGEVFVWGEDVTDASAGRHIPVPTRVAISQDDRQPVAMACGAHHFAVLTGMPLFLHHRRR